MVLGKGCCSVCPIQALNTCWEEKDGCLSEWIGRSLRSSLTALSCYFTDHNCKAQLLTQCRQLLELRIFEPSDDDLVLVARTCKQLRILSCWRAVIAHASDHGVEAIFANCHQLVEVRLRACAITYRSLQAVLDNKITLQTLYFKSPTLNSVDVEKFKLGAKELQLLPVPHVSWH